MAASEEEEATVAAATVTTTKAEDALEAVATVEEEVDDSQAEVPPQEAVVVAMDPLLNTTATRATAISNKEGDSLVIATIGRNQIIAIVVLHVEVTGKPVAANEIVGIPLRATTEENGEKVSRLLNLQWRVTTSKDWTTCYAKKKLNRMAGRKSS